MNLDPTAKRNKLNTFFKPLLGVSLLGLVVVWIFKQGTLIERLSVGLVFSSTAASFLINILNASVIRTIVSAYDRKISYASSLHLSALGAFGNAAGGLPIGTTLKFAILYKQSGLKVREITSGLILFTLAISLFLLGYASISIWAMDFTFVVKIIPVLVLALCIASPTLLWLWLGKNESIARLIRPLIVNGNLGRLMFISFSITTVFLFNYWVIGCFLFPDTSLMQIVFIASVGILTGLGSLLQSVGGVQEITMGFATLISGTSLLDGAQLALSMRITSLISSGIILGLFYLLPDWSAHQKHE